MFLLDTVSLTVMYQEINNMVKNDTWETFQIDKKGECSIALSMNFKICTNDCSIC